MKRLSKEYCLDINDCIDVKFGSVNRINPVIIYVSCKTWIRTQNSINYEVAINDVFFHFKNKLRNTVTKSDNFENKFICDFDINPLTIKENKKKYVSFEFFLKQKNEILSLNELNDLMENTFKSLINTLVSDLESYNFNLTKNK